MAVNIDNLMLLIHGLVPNVKTIGIITAENPHGKKANPVFNKSMNEKLEKRLREKNLGFVKVKGKYGNHENPFFVPNITKDEVLLLGKEYNQTDIIFGEKIEEGNKDGIRFSLIYSDHRMGDIIGQRDVFVDRKNADDYYTEIKGRKFQIPFFDDDMKDAEFGKGSGVIHKSKVNEELQKRLNESAGFSLEPNRTEKSRWVERGYIKNKLNDIYRSFNTYK